MPEECKGIGDGLIKLFPFTQLSEEAKTILKEIGNNVGSVCVAVTGKMLACVPESPPSEIKACCNIIDVSVGLRGLTKFSYKLKLAFMIEGAPVTGEIQFNLNFQAEERGRVLREFCNPPTQCEDEQVEVELYLHITGKYRPSIEIPQLGLEVGAEVEVDAQIYMGRVTATCHL